jgi:hypothetical protein
VTPGLYQVLFTRQLDDLSALALAEGGLGGFGLTVGLSDIVYHFTFHSDGRVYFDAAPDAALPSPLIPEPEDIHGWSAPAPTVTADAAPPVESTTIPSVSVTTIEGAVTDRRWRLVGFVLLGVGLGGGLHLTHRHLRKARPRNRQQKDKKTAPPEDNAATQTGDGGTTHA